MSPKLVRKYAIEGHTNRTSFLLDPPAMQAPIQANDKRPPGPPHAKKRRLHEDVGGSDAVRLASRSSDATSRYNPRAKQDELTQRTPRPSAEFGVPEEILAIAFDLAINSEFQNLIEELTQRNPDAYRRSVMPSVLSGVCQRWNSILMSKPSMWRRISFSLSENDELCDIPDDCSSSYNFTWQYRYVERAKKLPLDVIIHRWSSTESHYISVLLDSLFCVPLDAGRPLTAINFFRSIVITSAGGSVTNGAHVEPWPLRYCAPDVSLVSFGRQDWAALRPLLCSAQTLELYQSTTLPYQGCWAQTEHLFMEFTDACEEILPSHAVQYIIENTPNLRSLAVGYTTTGSLSPLSPRGLCDAFVHRSLDHLHLSPNDLGAALGAFEHGGLSAPHLSRVTLLELPRADPDLTARWARFAANIGAATVTRLDIDIDIEAIAAAHGADADAGWRALLVPFVGVTRLVVHPTASMPAVLRALLPVRPYGWSRRLLPSVRHIEMTRPDVNAFVAVREIVQDRLLLAKTGAPWISAIEQVDIYDYDSGAFSSMEWTELARLLEEARGYSRGRH